MAQQLSSNGVPILQISIVLDSGIFLTDASVAHEDHSEVGYFLPQIVVYGDYQEVASIDLIGARSKSRVIHVGHFDSGKNGIRPGVDYSDDFLKGLLRRSELYDGGVVPELIPSRFDWIFRFDSGRFRASSVKERAFKQVEAHTNQANGNRRTLRPIVHDVVVHYELRADEYFELSNDDAKLWSTADHQNVTKRFDIEIVAPHGTAENYYRDALNHKGQHYWLPNQGDPGPMGLP
jgi:hypothetical protein